MALTAQYVDGKLVTQVNQTQQSEKIQKKQENIKGGDTLDKDAFLQLLVAQMKYQDPLEPTSNTEYISQYATFSELEQMQNMSNGMTLQRASNLVGKEVIIETTTSSGKVTTVQGNVEKVVYNGSKAYLSINGALYSIDDLKQVVDDAYKIANDYLKEIEKIMKELPAVENLTIADLSNVSNVYNYSQLVKSYNEDMIDQKTYELIDKYVDRMNEIVKAAAEAAAAEEEAGETDEEAGENAEEAESGTEASKEG